MNACYKCKCNRCGRIHQCESILEMLMYYDSLKHEKCNPILSCKKFTPYRNNELNKDWKCPINKS